MKAKRSRRRPRRFLSSLLPVILLAVAVLGSISVVAVFRRQIGAFIFHRESRSASSGTLLAIREMAELETIAYVRKTVFPHDYLAPDLTMYSLVQALSEGGAPAETVLSESEYRHYRAANLASEVGLATRREQGGYVVVTTIVRFGYEVDEILEWYDRHVGDALPDQQGDAGSPGAFGLTPAMWQTFPPAKILSVETEDVHRDAYPYGAIPLNADEWRRVSSFVAEVPADAIQYDRFLDESRQRAIDLLRRLSPPD